MPATLANQAEKISSQPANLPANELLHGPLLSNLIRLALPTVAVLFMTTLLGVAETYFVSSLGLKAIAATSLVVPVMIMMTTVASAGIGGGVSSAIARATGARRQDEAESLAWHAVVIAVVAGGLFALVLLLAGPVLYRSLGGSGPSLNQAVLYSNILFGGAIPFWILLLLQASLRGAGNVKVPAMIILGGAVAGLILSPMLINGWLGAPRMGVAGAGVAQVLCNIAALGVVVVYMRSPSSTLRLRRYRLQRKHFSAILGVGLLSAINAVMSAMSVTALTAAAGAVSVAAIAGYGIASRLDMLLIPVMFGFGTAAITLVGTNLGAGNVARARRAAIVNVLFVASVVGLVGLVVSLFPLPWMGLFTSDSAAMAVGARYLHVVAPFYAVIGVIFELYFAGQGARRIFWPMTASVVRFVFALAAMVLVLQGYASLHTAFVIVAVSIVVAATISLLGFLRTRWDR
ncbi:MULTISPECIES: MATE family efflux transporter [Paraburkholderia]|uniref:MATE family efflux transporter n=1 Tax=Paraburkholderia TaxID=1822464 RepID=UPI002254715B|nr:MULTISPECIES: MATE family efflux transporter [Paraburkholderia]MCX4173410.1 MATE family efflux transporter [Paraburkholderia madseniana]MDQ6461415.1 MATE family efflux transporter [Paraburkholderia madseniana]